MAKADIEVNERRYSVACAPGQEARLAKLGDQLDMRVRQIQDAVGDIGEARLLLIAALALLDELDAKPANGQTGRAASSQSVDPMIEQKAAGALANAADRIDALAARLGKTGH